MYCERPSTCEGDTLLLSRGIRRVPLVTLDLPLDLRGRLDLLGCTFFYFPFWKGEKGAQSAPVHCLSSTGLCEAYIRRGFVLSHPMI
jgi:hypothetical protein